MNVDSPNGNSTENLNKKEVTNNNESCTKPSSDDDIIGDELIISSSVSRDKKRDRSPIQAELITLDSNSQQDLLKSNSTNIVSSDDEQFDLNIDFSLNKTLAKSTKSPKEDEKSNSPDNLKTWDFDGCYDKEYEVEVSDSDDDDNESIISIKSTQSAKKSGLSSENKSKKIITCKLKEFQIFLVNLTPELIELASRNAKQAAIKIREYEKKVLKEEIEKPAFQHFNFNFKKIFRTPLPLNDPQPSTSGIKRKIQKQKQSIDNFYDQFLGLGDESDDSLSEIPSKKCRTSNRDQSSDNDEENIKSKKPRNRKRFLSSSDESDGDGTSSLPSIDESDNFSWCSEDDELKTGKIKSKKVKLRFNEVYSDDDTLSLDESMKDDFIEVVKIFEPIKRKAKRENLVEDDLEKQQQTKENVQDGKENDHLITVVEPMESIQKAQIDHQQSQQEQPQVRKRQVGKRSVKKPTKRSKEQPTEIRTKSDLRELTKLEGENEIKRIKRIQKIKEIFDSLNNFSLLNNEQSVVLEYGVDGQPLVQIHPILSKSFKEHQKEGVRFLYWNTVESVESLTKKKGAGGYGTILGHNAGKFKNKSNS